MQRHSDTVVHILLISCVHCVNVSSMGVQYMHAPFSGKLTIATVLASWFQKVLTCSLVSCLPYVFFRYISPGMLYGGSGNQRV
jgi:hypothetical protein